MTPGPGKARTMVATLKGSTMFSPGWSRRRMSIAYGRTLLLVNPTKGEPMVADRNVVVVRLWVRLP